LFSDVPVAVAVVVTEKNCVVRWKEDCRRQNPFDNKTIQIPAYTETLVVNNAEIHLPIIKPSREGFVS